MIMTIPQTEGLSTSAMNRVFDTTTATYKFYWLLALLDMHVKEQKDEMLALDVAARMVAYAWYPTLCRLAKAIPCRRLFPMWLC